MDSTSDCNINPAAAIIREEIARRGPISFARFMQIALYHPEHGYYARNNIGKAGDFFTSVSVGPLFGQLLAFYLAGRLEKIPGQLKIVEAGANNGQMARDILDWLAARRPRLLERLTYLIIEPIPKLAVIQQEKLAGLPVEWASKEIEPFRGAFVANELLDAFPIEVYRWRKVESSWFQSGVSWSGDRFCWQDLAPARFQEFHDLEQHLPDGFAIELSPSAEMFWSNIARKLEQGVLMTFDYGYDRLNPAAIDGTLRGFHDHKLIEDVLASPGEIDITASVNFDRIRGAGALNGVATEALLAQDRFLTRILAEFHKTEKVELRHFQTLVDPNHLGRFKVLVQSRG